MCVQEGINLVALKSILNPKSVSPETLTSDGPKLTKDIYMHPPELVYKPYFSRCTRHADLILTLEHANKQQGLVMKSSHAAPL